MLDANQQAQATKPCKKTVHRKGGFVVQLIPDFSLKRHLLREAIPGHHQSPTPRFAHPAMCTG